MGSAGHPIVRVPERFSELSAPMQRALRLAASQGIPTDAPRSVRVQRRTAQVMEDAGLLARRETHKRKELWRATDRGRGLLVAHEPRFLHARSYRGEGIDGDPAGAGYTRDPAQAMHPDAGEAVDDVALAAGRRAAHHSEQERFEQLLAQRQRMPVLERLRLAQADAERRAVPIDRQMHVIKQRVRAIEELVYRPADRIATS